MNVNLAPVLDVYRQAGDFDDQYGRSYSKSPAVVSTLGADFIKAQQQAGVAATAKHFPGLGAATVSQDTDAGPVTLNVSRQSLSTIDELPYKAAIAAGVRLVMVSWATYPALDASRPAGLSSTIVQGQLREQLHFQGVTITDSLGAGALQAFGTFQQRAVLAAGAGMDLILCASQDVSQGEQAMDGLESGYLDGDAGPVGVPGLAAAGRRPALQPRQLMGAAERAMALRQPSSSLALPRLGARSSSGGSDTTLL